MKQARWYLVGADTSDGAALLYSQGDLEVLDTETEEVRWRLELFADLPGGDGAKWMLSNFDHGRPWLVEHDGEPAVLTEYFKPVCTRGGYCPGTPDDKAESGLVLLSGADGEVIWRALLIKANTGGDRFDERQNVWAVDENIALAHASVEKDGSDLRAVAINMKTGEQLWDTPDWFPLAFAGDQVIAVSSSALPEQTNDTSVADGTVGALDRKTGKPRWDLGDQFDQSKLNVAAGDVAVVRGSSAGKVRQVLVNTADGEVRDDFGSVDDRPA